MSEKNLLILIFAQTLEIIGKNIAIIIIDAYSFACQLKQAQVFAISIENKKFSCEKEVRPEPNWKNWRLEKYYYFLNMFSKKDLIY